VEFVHGGANVPVTAENRVRYIHMMAPYKLTHQVAAQARAMREGLEEVVSRDWLRMFDAVEMNVLFGGHASDGPMDIDDWRSNSTYGGEYGEGHRTIQLFWEVVNELTPQMQRRLLKFTTSVDRAPLLGFAHLYPKFCIFPGGTDVDRLPSASTCMCLLKLPPYADKGALREKLTTAIQHDTGFGLS
jgi:ubiquitin-protein ligase E3 C